MRLHNVHVAPGSDRVDAPSAPQWVGWLLAASLCLLASSLAWQWLCVGTYRFYLDERRAPAMSAPVRARQRFDVAGGRVTPQIVSTGDEHLSFPLDLSRPSELRLRVVPSTQATFEIAIVERGARRILRRRTLSEPADIVQPLPATSGLLELANEGELLWSDPRVVQEADVAPALLGLLALLGLTAFGRLAGRPVRPRVPAGGLGPHRPAERSRRRRHCRPLPRPPGGRPPGDRGPPAHLDHEPAPEPGRGEHGSPLAGLGRATALASLRASTPSASGSRATSSAWGSSRPASFATLPTASLSSPMPTASATPNRSRRPPWWRLWGTPSPTA